MSPWLGAKFPVRVDGAHPDAAPESPLGADKYGVLAELGYPQAEIARLAAAGAFGPPFS